MMNFEAASIHLWYQDGNRNKFKDADETTRDFYLDRAHDIVAAALGDTVLYEISLDDEHCIIPESHSGKCLVQVWPEVK